MSLENLTLKRCYYSDEDDLINDFYLPTLSKAILYKRMSGYFSSSSLAIVAKGIIGLINNGGSMELIISPQLSKRDVKAIREIYENPVDYIGNEMLKDINEVKEQFIKDHIFALCWMLANNRLEIKVALPHNIDDNNDGIFHQKIGIFLDEFDNCLSFSGSINETANGWLNNVEEFKVFRGWVELERYYLQLDVDKFNNYWNNKAQRVQVHTLPSAIKKKMMAMAPDSYNELSLKRWYSRKEKKINLFSHQEDAVNAWLKNNCVGLLEMATGTGKTFTALGCVEKALEKYGQLMIIIACPQNHLVQQWKEEIDKYGINADKTIIADSTNKHWKKQLSDALFDQLLGNLETVFVLTSHGTFSKDFFQNKINEHSSRLKFMLIADEVHGMGAEKSSLSLNSNIGLRLGLSATPKRWFDTKGTEKIYSYFKKVVYEFGLNHAIINGFLTPYRYDLSFVSLNDEEISKYIRMTKAIVTKMNKAKEAQEDFEKLLFARANIVKNAEEKFEALNNILEGLGADIEQTIIYCSPEQKDRIFAILAEREIIFSPFTMEIGVTPQKKHDNLSERGYLLKMFGQGEFQVLVAIKCLDEGVDVPQAKNAIFMSSSGNPREYIQRIGRVIRKYRGKSEANLFDIVVKPSTSVLPPELLAYEKMIFEKERKRCEEIGRNASNWGEVLAQLHNT